MHLLAKLSLPAAALAATLGLGATASAQSYTATLLTPTAGQTDTWATSINAFGEIVGGPYAPVGSGPLWTLPGLTPATLAAPANATGWMGLYNNDGGDVAGSAIVGGVFAPVLWEAGVPSYLAIVAGHTETNVTAINSAGDMSGTSRTAGNNMRALRWVNGAVSMLNLPAGQVNCYGDGINDAGVVVGHCGVGYLAERPVKWTGAAPTVLPLPKSAVSAKALNINTAGDIVGSAFFDNPQRTFAATFTTTKGKLLTKSSSVTGSAAQAVNTAGKIVGWASLSSGLTYASLWPDATSHVVLPMPAGYVFCRALDIDDADRIVGLCSTTYAGPGVPVVWLPTP